MSVRFNWIGMFLRTSVLFVLFSSYATSLPLTPRMKKDAEPSPPREVEPWRPYYIAHACEWTFMTLNCPLNRVINVVRASYGRQNFDYCPHMRSMEGYDWKIPCAGSTVNSRRVAGDMCNGKVICKFPVFDGLFQDLCPNHHKYLEVYYACVASPPISRNPSTYD